MKQPFAIVFSLFVCLTHTEGLAMRRSFGIFSSLRLRFASVWNKLTVSFLSMKGIQA